MNVSANSILPIQTIQIHLGHVIHLSGDSFQHSDPSRAIQEWPRGALVVRGATIEFVGDRSDALRIYPQAPQLDHGAKLILPGFIDSHIHFPQIDVIGSYGEELLGWLERYTFPAEQAFADLEHAKATSHRFIDELLANGTTTASIFASSHLPATEALLQSCLDRGLRARVGKVSMDRHGPQGLLCDTATEAEKIRGLIERWEGREGRLGIALTPRFAPSCSLSLLKGLGQLAAEFPKVLVQTHFAESKAELDWVKELFPKSRDYLSVYEDFGLLGPATLLAHGIHTSDDELRRIAASGARIAHCPTSNTFLGSGLLSLRRLTSAGVETTLATDVGGGTSFSMWATMAEAYKVQQLRGEGIHPVHVFDYATLSGARALGLEARTGNLAAGKCADFQVLDWARSRLLRGRLNSSMGPSERMFALMFLADDRLTDAVYIDGRQVFQQSSGKSFGSI